MTDGPFDILGIEARFEIDPADVRRRAVRRAARLHPDRASDPVTAAEQARELALVNEASGILLDDIARAELLLAMHGGPGPSEDRTLPEGFLESILATRMELEEAVASGDQEGRKRLADWARSEWAERRAAVASILDRNAPPVADDLNVVRRELNRWRYSQRMLEQLEPSDTVPGP